MNEKEDRAARLARQLRENLRKRKAHARETRADDVVHAERDGGDSAAD